MPTFTITGKTTDKNDVLAHARLRFPDAKLVHVWSEKAESLTWMTNGSQVWCDENVEPPRWHVEALCDGRLLAHYEADSPQSLWDLIDASSYG